MPDYSAGKIYKLVSKKTNEIYIGSTTMPLSVRLSKHKNHHKLWSEKRYNWLTSYKLTQYLDCKIELLEECECDTKEELLNREDYWREKYQKVCVNKRCANIKNNKNDTRQIKYTTSIKGKELRDKYKHLNLCIYCDSRTPPTHTQIYKIHEATKKHQLGVKIINEALNCPL